MDDYIATEKCSLEKTIDDGFVPMKSNQKKKTEKRATTGNKFRATNHTESGVVVAATSSSKYNRNNVSSIRFGASKWAKPSTPTIVATSASAQLQQQQKQLIPMSTSTAASTPLPMVTSTIETIESAHTPKSDPLVDAQNTNDGVNQSSWKGQLQQQTLSSLMEDYGEYDPNWMKMEPTITFLEMDVQANNETNDSNTDRRVVGDNVDGTPSTMIQEESHDVDEPTESQLQDPQVVNGINRLQLHGHAPIHVEFVSFGYKYGIPSEIRYYSTGNCYNQPLVPFDIRPSVAPIPTYLFHIDGKAGIIKNTMLRWRSLPPSSEEYKPRQSSKAKTPGHDNNKYINIRDFVNDTIIPPVSNAIIDAIDIGQHGYVSPITISIFIGSEFGKHRSVVGCEVSAIALRKLLRVNRNNQFRCPISVGCRHRDLMNQQHQLNTNATNKAALSKKQKAFEDE